MKRIIEQADKARIRFVKVEFAVLMICLVLLALVFSRPEIVGYASTNVHSQDLNLVIENSQRFYLRSLVPEPVHLTSLTISGEVLGEGTVTIYLDNERGIRNLVYKNVKRKDSTHNRITGTSIIGGSVTGNSIQTQDDSPVLDLLEGPVLSGYEFLHPAYRAVQGEFHHACVESCLLQARTFEGNRFIIDFFIEPGTKLRIKEIVYTTLEDL
ncbi:hypothetical protein KY338_00035 [Candidatus Woesearchaeota archaeon]|nr:hypothetical protein [Candidatus Woesearchaeota archaeon]MBW3005290.1 hypothetical protein [Candidatus Woesearchaeota archaeon]